MGEDAAYAAQGHDREEARRLWEARDFAGLLRYQAPFAAGTIERGLRDHAGGVIEIGAFQASIDDPALLQRVRRALPLDHRVVLLLPSTDDELSAQVLDARDQVLYDGVELNEHFVRHHANHDLAKIRVYTEGQTPQETCAAIVAQLDPTSADVVLIGPMGAGKSTLGKLLAANLGRPQVSLDAVRWGYYREIGFDEAAQREIRCARGVRRCLPLLETVRGPRRRARAPRSPRRRDRLWRRALGV